MTATHMRAARPRLTLAAELHAAVREVAAAFNRLPAAAQARIDVAARDSLEAEVDAAILAGDRERAEAAIRAWRGHWLAEFEAAAAPSQPATTQLDPCLTEADARTGDPHQEAG